MGLDIYGHHTRIPFEGDKTNINDFSAFTDKVDKLAQKTLSDKINEMIKPLRDEWNAWKGLNGDAPNNYREHTYNLEYFTFVGKLRPLIARNYEFKMYPYTDKILELPELEKLLDAEVKDAYEEYDIYFRKVNFLYAYFENKGKMIDEYFVFVEPEDVEDIISRCEQVLNDHSKATELLPTQAGFFFGSTDYDEWYYHDVQDCLKQMRGWLPMLEEKGVTGYMIFSW